MHRVRTRFADGATMKRYTQRDIDKLMARGIKLVTCSRCGYSWYPRTPTKPKVCANKKCKSPYWNVPRRVKKNEEPDDSPDPEIESQPFKRIA